MKKSIMLLVVLSFITTTLFANHPSLPSFAIPITMQITKVKGNIGNPIPRSPIQAIEVGYYDHTLYFAQEFENDILVTLEDEYEVEVYSAYLYAGQTQLSLPTDLTGNYTLYIYKGNFAFAGEIALD